MDITLLDYPNLNFREFGARGIGEIGEIGVTGLAAAVANAVYHATGKRIRSLPITKEKLMAGPQYPPPQITDITSGNSS